jgi:short-subunit dehydrogenase
VVITGGSRGLGLEIAREIASEGATLVLLARDEAELSKAKDELTGLGAPVFTWACDLRDRAKVAECIDHAAEACGRIDVLINNAGVIGVGPLNNMTLEDFDTAMDTHFSGPLVATLAALPYLRQGGGGRIVNIASIGGRVAVPHLIPYSASKFALIGLSDGLRSELRRENIYVTTVAPGLMRTGSPPHATFKGKHRDEYAWFAIADSLPGLSMHSREAARKIVRACKEGQATLNLGLSTKIAAAMNGVFPGLTGELAAMAIALLPNPAPEKGGQSYSGRESESKLAPSSLTQLSDAAATRNNELPAVS